MPKKKRSSVNFRSNVECGRLKNPKISRKLTYRQVEIFKSSLKPITKHFLSWEHKKQI